MRVHSLLAAGFVAGACVLFAPSARADGFFVTFMNGTTTLGSRVQGATFETSTSSANAARSEAKLEIDDWSLAVPTLDALDKAAVLTVKVEFTTPNAQGQEEVDLIATYQTATITRVAGTYDVAVTPKAKESLDLTYASVLFSQPQFAATDARAVRRLPTVARTIRRSNRAVAAAQRIDDAYFQAPSFPGESSDHPGLTRLLGFAFVGYQADFIGKERRPVIRISSLTMTKAPGAATASFQSALSTKKPFTPATITFVQHHGTSPDTTSKTVLLTNAYVVSDRLQAGATSVETIALAADSLRLTAGTATVELMGNPPAH